MWNSSSQLALVWGPQGALSAFLWLSEIRLQGPHLGRGETVSQWRDFSTLLCFCLETDFCCQKRHL